MHVFLNAYFKCTEINEDILLADSGKGFDIVAEDMLNKNFKNVRFKKSYYSNWMLFKYFRFN